MGYLEARAADGEFRAVGSVEGGGTGEQSSQEDPPGEGCQYQYSMPHTYSAMESRRAIARGMSGIPPV